MKILWICLIFYVIQCNGLTISDPLQDPFEALDPTPFETPKTKENEDVQRGSRIVFGLTATTGQFPHYALLQIRRSTVTVQCGGGLISTNFVLTAKHCVNDARSIETRFGLTHKDFYEQIAYAIAVARHSNVDIALVKLDRTLKITSAVKPALLPRYVEKNEQFANRMSTISGFGVDNTGWPSPVMKFTDLKIITNSACVPYFGIVDKAVMCAKSTDSKASTCPGDSGSSLTLKEPGVAVVVGVVSYGHGAGCDKGYPVGYVRTAQQLDWILSYSGVNKRS